MLMLGAVFLILLGAGIAFSLLSMIARREFSYAGCFSTLGAGAFYLLFMVRVMELASAEVQGDFDPSRVLIGGYTVLLLLILAASLEGLAKNIDRILENRKNIDKCFLWGDLSRFSLVFFQKTLYKISKICYTAHSRML